MPWHTLLLKTQQQKVLKKPETTFNRQRIKNVGHQIQKLRHVLDQK